MYEITTRSKKV